jgi:hypothetical protein
LTLPAVIFSILAGFFLLRLPRHWAALPLLMGASYMPTENALELGPFHFPVIRILIAIGIIRVLIRGERLGGGWNMLDRMMILWAVWAVCSSCFHKDVSAALIYRLGLVYNSLGLYLLLRVFIEEIDCVAGLYTVTLVALAPVALEMISEATTGKNLFSLLGGVAAESEMRGGKIRAQGPFSHPILAGTVGAICLPMAVLFWKRSRRVALLGLTVAGSMVIASRCSGPLMTCIFALFALVLWKFRSQMRLIRWATVLGILALGVVMEAPIYYLLARIDLTGHSTSFHRAILIEAAIKHLDEWWLGGTDYTLHWTPNPGFGNDTDITNHYIRMGVWGGLPMMLLFIGVLVVGFVSVSKALRLRQNSPLDEQFLIWTLGCLLFAQTASMISVSYFDQSIFFLYLVLAAIGSLETAPTFERTVTVDWPVDHEGNLCHHS